MTVVPSLLITGILAILLGVLFMAWSVFGVEKRRGGLVMILLSIPLLLFGGGIFPPLIGIVAGALGTRVNRPMIPKRSHPGRPLWILSCLWPWSLVLYLIWVFGQFVLGHFFNDWLAANGYIIILMVLGTL